MSSEVWYERATAVMLTQKNENEELEQRYFPQVENTVLDEMGNEIKSKFYMLLDKNNKLVYFKSELEAIQYAIEYRNSKNGY